MGKNPCFLFYPNDWERDLSAYPWDVGGAWMLTLCALYWEGGESTKSLDEWARILRENRKKTLKILQFFSEKNIGNVLFLDNQNITITCRRMKRDLEIRELRRNVGKMGGNPILKKKQENLLNQNPTLSVSVSVSDSKINKKADVFNVPSKEQIEHGSNTLLMDSLENLSRHLKQEEIFPEVYAFKNLCVRNKVNLRALCHTLTRCIAARPEVPWAYCVAIMKKEDGNFNARDYEKSKA